MTDIFNTNLFKRLEKLSKKKPIAKTYNLIRINPKLKFILIGGIAGFLTEFIYWLVQRFSGVTGVQASPHFFQNLLGTMPLYITIVALLLVVETKYNYSLFAILIYSGIYDFFADGALGIILTSGGLPIESILLMLISFPIFVVSYSFMLLPASYLLKNDPKIKQPLKTGWKKYIYGLLPIIGILIFGIIAFFLFL